jgi:hypothetical protein
MHLLYCDESNMEERAGDFLVYAGVAIPAERATALSAAIEELRTGAGVDRAYRLKFNPGPANLDHAGFIALKEAVLRVAADHGAQLFAYVILHDISKDPDTARRNGINSVCFHFNSYLNKVGGPGLVLIDQFTDQGNLIAAHLRDKFTIGLTGMPYARELRLGNIVGFHYCAVGQSHFPSLVDVATGSLRFALNACTREIDGQRPTAFTLLQLLSPLLHRHRADGAVSEWGFQFSPKIIKAAKYRHRYERLKAFFEEAGVRTEQPITDERQY